MVCTKSLIQRFMPWILASMSGLLYGRTQFFGPYCGWISLTPLLLAILIEPKKHVFKYSLLSGLFFSFHVNGFFLYGGLTYWSAALYLSLTHALYGYFTAYTYRTFNFKHFFIVSISLWILKEYLSTKTFVSLPNGLAHSVIEFTIVLQIASLFGSYGISLLLIMVNTFLALLFYYLIYNSENLLFKKQVKFSFIITLCFLIFVLSYGYIRLNNPIKSYLTNRVLVVQSGMSNKIKQLDNKEFYSGSIMKSIYYFMTKKDLDFNPDIVVWPETALTGYLISEKTFLKDLLNILNKNKAVLISGTKRADLKTGNHNSAVLISPFEKKVQYYDKQILATPTEMEFVKGQNIEPFIYNNNRLGVAICLEAAYPEVLRSHTNAGSNVLFVLSNDAGFRNSPIYRYQIRQSLLRAVENGRFLVRASQAGISAIISPYGQYLNKMELFESGTIKGKVGLIKHLTFFTRFGYILPLFFLCLTFIILIIYIAGKQKIK